jgi:membrane-associated HD superfamily phosphohydrolase
VNLWAQLERGSAASPPPERTLHHAARGGLAVALAVITYLLFPAAPAAEFPLLEVGTVATQDVIAPFAFSVPKPADDLAREREAAAGAVLPVLTYTPAVADSARAALRAFGASVERITDVTAPGPDRNPLDRAARIVAVAATQGVRLDPDEAAYLVAAGRIRSMVAAIDTAFARWVSRGVASNATVNDLAGEVTIRGAESDREVKVDSVLTFARLVPLALGLRPDPGTPVADTLYLKLLGAFFRPTIELDRAATERRREQARGTVDPSRFVVRAGEKIVGAHEVVGREEYDKMRTARAELEGRRGTERQFSRVAGAVLFNLLVIALFGVTLLLFRPQLYASLRALLVIAATFTMVLIAAAVVSRAETLRPELIPVALAAVALSVLFDARISMVAAMIIAVLLGGQGVYRGTNTLFVVLIAGSAAAISGRVIRRRTDVVYPVATITLGYALVALAMGLTLGWSVETIARSAGWGALNAVVSLALALVILPAAEELTGIDTYPKLLEWSDLNRPLMRRLSLEAPGTYNHTVVLPTWPKRRATRSARTGSSRVWAPTTTTSEAQQAAVLRGEPGRGATRTTSSSLARRPPSSATTCGRASSSPRSTGCRRACGRSSPSTTAPGRSATSSSARRSATGRPRTRRIRLPRPRATDRGDRVCMLADGVEAATRVLNDPTPQKIRDVIEHIVRQRMDQGQLRDAPLTLQQLEVVKEQFARLLIGQYHNRIDYPTSSGGVTAEFAAVPGASA